LLKDRLFLTNSNSKLSLIILSIKKIISYIVIIKKLVKRTTNVNIDIGFIFLSNIKYLFNLNIAFGLQSLRSRGKEKILAYIRS
jgi:hypothetical protein